MMRITDSLRPKPQARFGLIPEFTTCTYLWNYSFTDVPQNQEKYAKICLL